MIKGLGILSLFTLLVSCKQVDAVSLKIDCREQVKDYETYVARLDIGNIFSLDSAAAWFRAGYEQCRDLEKQDSMFMPFFTLYNEVGDSLTMNKDIRVAAYGFKVDTSQATWKGRPSESTFLKDSIIAYLSPAMRSFSIQNLKEFDDEESFQVVMRNTLWWDKFIRDHEDFFLQEMVEYHYEQWHLRHLVSGYRNVKVVDENNILLKSVEEKYRGIIKHNSSSSTAKTLSALLSRIEENGMRYPDDIEEFVDEVLSK